MKIPSCINGKRHIWINPKESLICRRCGYDRLDLCYKPSFIEYDIDEVKELQAQRYSNNQKEVEKDES